MDPSIETLDHARQAAGDYALRFAPKLAAAALILLAGWFVTGWIVNVARGGLERFDLEPPVRLLIERGLRALLLGMVLILALQNLGVELLPLVAGLGIAGAGVALALQGVLGNLAAGLIIIFTKPFRVGEYISIVGEEGEVRAITLFGTILRHADRSDVVIPNRKIGGEILHNYGAIRQLPLAVRVGYGTDLGVALRLVREVLEASPRLLRDPEPFVSVATLADSSIEIAVRPWVAVPDYAPACGEVNRALVEAFRARGLAIALPQQEVRLLGSTGA